MNIKKEEELFKLKDNITLKSNGYTSIMNKFRLEIRKRFLIIKEVKFWK